MSQYSVQGYVLVLVRVLYVRLRTRTVTLESSFYRYCTVAVRVQYSKFTVSSFHIATLQSFIMAHGDMAEMEVEIDQPPPWGVDFSDAIREDGGMEVARVLESGPVGSQGSLRCVCRCLPSFQNKQIQMITYNRNRLYKFNY